MIINCIQISIFMLCDLLSILLNALSQAQTDETAVRKGLIGKGDANGDGNGFVLLLEMLMATKG